MKSSTYPSILYAECTISNSLSTAKSRDRSLSVNSSQRARILVSRRRGAVSSRGGAIDIVLCLFFGGAVGFFRIVPAPEGCDDLEQVLGHVARVPWPFADTDGIVRGDRIVRPASAVALEQRVVLSIRGVAVDDAVRLGGRGVDQKPHQSGDCELVHVLRVDDEEGPLRLIDEDSANGKGRSIDLLAAGRTGDRGAQTVQTLQTIDLPEVIRFQVSILGVEFGVRGSEASRLVVFLVHGAFADDRDTVPGSIRRGEARAGPRKCRRRTRIRRFCTRVPTRWG